MSFFCPVVVGRKFPWKTYNVSKRSRENGLSQLQHSEESEAYSKTIDTSSKEKLSSKVTVNKDEFGYLLTGASLEKPANVKATVMWNYAPTHATDISARKGDIVLVFYRNGEWLFVENSRGGQGFIPFNFCTLSNEDNGDHVPSESKVKLKNTQDPNLRVFESESELPTVRHNKEKLKSEVNKISGISNATEVKATTISEVHCEVKSVADKNKINHDYVEIDSMCVTGKVKSVQQSTTVSISTCMSGEPPVVSVTKQNEQCNDIEKQAVDESKLSECSNNESSGTQSDSCERRKGLRFLQRKTRRDKKANKSHKKKSKRETQPSRTTKGTGNSAFLDTRRIDAWNWQLYDSDSSSDSSDDEAVFKEILSHRESRDSFRAEQCAAEEAFVSRRITQPQVDTAYALAEQIIYQKDKLLAACDDIMWSARQGGKERDVDISTKTRHFSMLLEERDPVHMISGAKSQDFTSSFAQVRKLTTSTQLEDIRDQLSKLQMKELCVPKPKCLVDETIFGATLSSGSIDSNKLAGYELYEEPLNEELMVVSRTFVAENSEEVSVTAGDRVFVCNACEHEDWWWANTVDGREGFLPKAYLSPVVNNEIEVTVVESHEQENTDRKAPPLVVNAKQNENSDIPHEEELKDDSTKSTTKFPRSLPLCERNDNNIFEQKSDTVNNRGPLKMCMVAPTLRTDITPKTGRIEERLIQEDEDLLKKPLNVHVSSPAEGQRFHSYENINSELFLDSVRKHIEEIDEKRKFDEDSELIKPCPASFPISDSDDVQDPEWVSAYLNRYTNKTSKFYDDRPRALRRRDTIASTRPQGKRVRFQSNPDLSSDCNGPLVTVHRYEVDASEEDSLGVSKYVVKNGVHGEMELATWC